MSGYLSVLVTLIIGLAITDLALSAHRLLRARQRVRWHWMTPLVGLIFLLQLLGFWWIWFDAYADRTSLSVAQFLPDLAILLLLFLASATALPDEIGNGELTFALTTLTTRNIFGLSSPFTAQFRAQPSISIFSPATDPWSRFWRTSCRTSHW